MLEPLYTEIKERQKFPQEGSYTNYLFTKGLDKILKKVGEEASEVIIAAKNENQAELVSEVADLAYHVLVLLAEKNVSLSEVTAELTKRQGKISQTTDRKEIEKL